MPPLPRRGLVALGLGAALPTPAAAQRLAREASARPSGPFRRDDFDMVGVFDADWLTEPRFVRVLDTLAASPGAVGAVRMFGVLNAGTREMDFPTSSGGTWTDPAAAPDFTAALAALEALVARGLVPFLALGFFPKAVSLSPVLPPPDLGPWRRLVRDFLAAAAARFGPAELERWWFEAWNEPNMPPFWQGDFDAYLALHRATVEAMAESGLRLRHGGPALAWLPGEEAPALMRRFLEFLRDAPEIPCAFLSFHRKGAWTEAEGAPRLGRLVEAAETVAALALEIVPQRVAAGLAIVNDEADMRVGFQHPFAPRLDASFPAWLAAATAAHAALGARHAGRGLRFLAAADNANQQLVQEPFDGRRALFTPTAAARPADLVKLPVFGFYEMLRMLAGGLCLAEAPPEGPAWLVTAEADRVAAMLALTAGGPAAVELVLRDLPWPRADVTLFRIDAATANAFAAAGGRMPSPAFAAAEAARLRQAAELVEAAPPRRGIRVEGGRLEIPLRLDPPAVALVVVTPPNPLPPAAPRWIEARAEAGDVLLRWTPNRETRFRGYELVRVAPRHRVAPLLRGALWVDTAPAGGRAVRYAVRAVSFSGAASAWVEAPPVSL